MLLLIISIIIVALIIVVAISKANQRRKSKSSLYFQSECPNYIGPHGDSLMSIFIEQKHRGSRQLLDVNKSEWEVIEKYKSEPDGSCQEYVKITELRNNRSAWEYHICWIGHFEWLLQFDLPRVLSDNVFFNEYLLKAESGDSDAQTLVGSCYAHCLALAKPVVTCDEEKALYWWNKAAEQGHRYAMMELAIYYYNKNNLKEAITWNTKGKCRVLCIERHTNGFVF